MKKKNIAIKITEIELKIFSFEDWCDKNIDDECTEEIEEEYNRYVLNELEKILNIKIKCKYIGEQTA